MTKEQQNDMIEGYAQKKFLQAWPMFESFFEHFPDAVSILDTTGKVIFANRSAETIFGWTIEEMIGVPLPYITVREYRTLESVLTSGLPHAYGDKPKRRKNGEKIYVKTIFAPIKDLQGNVIAIAAILIDMTERKRLEKNLQSAHRELSETLRYQPGMTFIFKEKNGKFIHTLCEGELFYRLGLNSEQVIGKELSDFVPQSIARELLPYYRRAWQGEENVVHRVTYKKITFLAFLKPIFRNGQVQEVIASCVDISELQQVEKLLRESEQRYQRLLKFLPEPIFVQIDGTVVYINKAGTRSLGASFPEELIGKSMLDIIHPDFQAFMKKRMREVIKADDPLPFSESKLVCQDGKPIDVEVSSIRIHNYYGKMAVLVVFHDITERKKAEELMRRSEKMSAAGQLAAGVAHEIRNPLTTLKGFTQLLKNKYGDNGYFDIMLSELDRINFIVNELMLLAKPQSVQFTKVHLRNIVASVVTLLETQAIMNNIRIDTQFEEIPCIVDCDENQLKQVFVNILKNAIEAMPHGGEVKIRMLCSERGKVTVRFTDQGEGIPPEVLSRLGEPFYTTKETGNGLGLMVSYKIIEAHKGKVEIESEVGKGTRIDIQLPLC